MPLCILIPEIISILLDVRICYKLFHIVFDQCYDSFRRILFCFCSSLWRFIVAGAERGRERDRQMETREMKGEKNDCALSFHRFVLKRTHESNSIIIWYCTWRETEAWVNLVYVYMCVRVSFDRNEEICGIPVNGPLYHSIRMAHLIRLNRGGRLRARKLDTYEYIHIYIHTHCILSALFGLSRTILWLLLLPIQESEILLCHPRRFDRLIFTIKYPHARIHFTLGGINSCNRMHLDKYLKHGMNSTSSRRHLLFTFVLFVRITFHRPLLTFTLSILD